ncbi:MAG TPA: hypothetical protein VGH20_16375 [Myxococcales bacterium]
MKEALKLLGAIGAIIVSVTAFHGARPAPHSFSACQPTLCGPAFPCTCGTCVRQPGQLGGTCR